MVGEGAKKVSFTVYSSCRLQLLHIIFVRINRIQTFLKRKYILEQYNLPTF